MGEASLLEHPLEASEVDHGVLNWALHLGIWLPFGGKVGAVVVGMPTCYLGLLYRPVLATAPLHMLLSLLGSFLLSCPFTRLRLHLAVELLHPQGSLCLASVSQQPLLPGLNTAGASLAGWRAQLQLSNFCDDGLPPSRLWSL